MLVTIVELDGVSYYYVRNLLGDVIGVIDTSGNLVVQYTYDSWGKVLSTTGSMADTVGTLNPIRYRGYYYDVETGLYYLQSRYYDPETGRFISPDVVAEGGNIYTYCLNDPVNRSDESGYLSRRDKNIIKIAIGVVTTVAAVAITVATGGAALPVIAGVAASTLIGAGISAGITALQGGSDAEIFDSAVDGAINGFMWGGISAFASASVGAIKGGITAAKTVDGATSITKTGQKHHVITRSMEKEMAKNPRLSGINRNDYIVQAVDQQAHRGYQTWHRQYDAKVLTYLRTHPNVSARSFKKFVNNIINPPKWLHDLETIFHFYKRIASV